MEWKRISLVGRGPSYGKYSVICRRVIGFYPDLSVYDYMLYIASIKGIKPIMAKKRALKLLEQVGMAEKEKKKMRTLSGHDPEGRNCAEQSI